GRPWVESAAQVWTSRLGITSVPPHPPVPRSFRVSYQERATSPLDWSRAIDGSYWLLVVLSSFSLTAGDQVAPLSSECWSMMSVLALSFGVSSVQTRYTRPLWAPPLRS